MPRLPRVVLPGQPHHLIQRGNNRSPIFFHPHDYPLFLDCLRDASQRYSCQIHADGLRTHHIHLLVSPETETALASLMQSVERRYVQYVNRCCQRTGTWWEGRYRAVLIDADPCVLTCDRDIECNPVRAQRVSDPAAYPWSSYGQNAHGQCNPLLHAPALSQALGPDTSHHCPAYRALLAQELDAER